MYDVHIDSKIVAIGLSPGELNQWLIELNDELSKKDSEIFQKDLGYVSGDFENFLYNNKIISPMNCKFGKSKLEIIINDL